ncbi:glycosyltransferase family 2 protein [Methylibium sp.]|uniref:glycosyltransferase family 2 protein n=1 Tax=Methylibium sp. TaxID=2067992 RepID=UPI003D0C7FB7
MISVLVLTKNEERDLPGCLASVAWSDDIHVFDSGSTDGTPDVARALHAHVTQRVTDEAKGVFGGDEAAHRNWGLRNIAFRHPWVLLLDADERATPALAANLKRAAEAPQGHVAFEVQRRDFLDRTWLKHVQATPYYLRLFQPNRLHYERLINPVSVADGPVGKVAGYIDHYPFSKGLSHWLKRHNDYSTLEAMQIAANRQAAAPVNVWKAFFGHDFSERRAQQKELFYRAPARPLIKFLLLYVLKRGFLDGRAGLTYAVLQSMYEYMIVLKTDELRNARRLGEARSV